MLVRLLLVSLVSMVTAYPRFQDAIPNGASVPHPCDPVRRWQGVGHMLSDGGGRRNQFGLDFHEAGEIWTLELCKKDSDGDGLTNGQELGDPDCTWTPASGSPSSAAHSHPGVCEPLKDPKCQAYNAQFGDLISCGNDKETSCPALKERFTHELDIQFPVTPVPVQVTSYHCLLVEFPADRDYHLVASTPILNNTDIVHHMILFGCEDSAETTVHRLRGQVYPCGMAPLKECQSLIATWGYGLKADCFDSQAGIRIGDTGIRFGALQIHYNNPRLLVDQTDQSGMTLYYTDRLRPFDASVFMIGQNFIQIPPYSKSTTVETTCPGMCTAHMFEEPIYITRCVHHMHSYGKTSSVVIYRNGSLLQELATIHDYHYDSPTFFNFDPPIKVLPGDDIFVNCTYSSNSNRTVSFGLGTQDEMCYAFLTYYPKQNFLDTTCLNWKSVQRCIRKLDHFKGQYGECNYYQFLKNELPSLFSKTSTNESCGYFANHQKCTDQCIEHSKEILNHACMQGDLGDFFAYQTRRPEITQLFKMCASTPSQSSKPPSNSDSHLNTSASCKSSINFFLVLILITNLITYAIRI